VARTEHLRRRGASYRELEAAGLRLVVSEVSVRYRQPARFDDLLRIRCWVRRLESRRVEFGYAVDHADDGRLLATATVALLALDTAMALRRLPAEVGRVLTVAPDPVRLGFNTAGIHGGGTRGDSPRSTDGIHHRGTEDTE
jgi:acyl-CoA thioester hydrolase